MKPRIDVYSKPDCVQCGATYRALDAKGLAEGVDSRKHDLTLPENDAALQRIMNDLGYSQALIIVTDDNH